MWSMAFAVGRVEVGGRKRVKGTGGGDTAGSLRIGENLRGVGGGGGGVGVGAHGKRGEPSAVKDLEKKNFGKKGGRGTRLFQSRKLHMREVVLLSRGRDIGNL